MTPLPHWVTVCWNLEFMVRGPKNSEFSGMGIKNSLCSRCLFSTGMALEIFIMAGPFEVHCGTAVEISFAKILACQT